MTKRDGAATNNKRVEAEQASKPWAVILEKVAEHKDNQGGGPQEEVAKDVKE